MASFVENGVSLSSVLGKVRVYEMDKVVSDWCGENCRHGNAFDDLLGVIALVDRYNWSRSHVL